MNKEYFLKGFNLSLEDLEKVANILDKKHSDRTDKEKETIRNIVRSNKRELPKINVRRGLVFMPMLLDNYRPRVYYIENDVQIRERADRNEIHRQMMERYHLKLEPPKTFLIDIECLP